MRPCPWVEPEDDYYGTGERPGQRGSMDSAGTLGSQGSQDSAMVGVVHNTQVEPGLTTIIYTWIEVKPLSNSAITISTSCALQQLSS